MKNPVTTVSDWVNEAFIRAQTAWSKLREDDRGLTTLEVAVIATALLAAAILVAGLITSAVDSHSKSIK